MAEQAPRVVHLVWLGSPVPPQVERLRDDVLHHDPDVEVRIWRDDDLGWLTNRDLFDRERRQPARADIARYEILHRHGGIYLDADFRAHRSLAEVFTALGTHGLVVARQSRTVYNNAFLAAAPGHPLLADLIAALPDAYRWTGGMTAPATSGPHLLTERLLVHLRRGGSALELPQHAVYPWYADEEPLPPALLPPSVLVSHEWASMGRTSWAGGADEDGRPSTAAVPDRRSRQRSVGRTLRARAASSPAVHRLVTRRERRLARVGGPADRRVGPERVETPTDRVLDGWVARRALRELRGSAVLLDLHPATDRPFLAAARTLDRPGRALLVRDIDPMLEPDPAWRDPSIRCSMSLLHCDTSPEPRVRSIVSHGSPLLARTIDADTPPIGAVTGTDVDLAALIADLPRLDLVRVDADRLTHGVADVLTRLTTERRIARLMVTLDPMSASPGVDLAVRLIGTVEGAGLGATLGPWLLDGRGRTWRQQLRVATRPFVVALG